MSRTFDYSVFGLAVRSTIELPELFGAQDAPEPDVDIRVGALTDPTSAPGLTVQKDCLLLTIPSVGRYRITGGREIVIEPEAAAPERNVRLYLLGSAFGALLHQRGLLPLHANAVEIGGKAVAFMGESGAGKSTLAASFHDRGFQVIADDVSVIQFGSQGDVRACPGLPRLRLAAEVLEATGREPSRFPPSYLGDQDFRKYDVSINAGAAREPVEIGAIFVLEKGDSFGVERLSGGDAAKAVFDHTYRGEYLDHVEGHHAHWAAATKLVGKVPIYRLSRIWDIARIDEQCELITQWVRDFAFSSAANWCPRPGA